MSCFLWCCAYRTTPFWRTTEPRLNAWSNRNARSFSEHESKKRKECITETRCRRGNSQELIYVIKLAVFLTLYGWMWAGRGWLEQCSISTTWRGYVSRLNMAVWCCITYCTIRWLPLNKGLILNRLARWHIIRFHLVVRTAKLRNACTCIRRQKSIFNERQVSPSWWKFPSQSVI